MSYIPKTASDYKEQLIEQIRDGIIKIEREAYTFDEEVKTYILSGSSDTAKVLFIDAVEGINVSGSWVPPEGSYNDVSAWVQADWEIGDSIPDNTQGDYILYWTGSAITTPTDSAYPSYPLYQSIRWLNPPDAGESTREPKHGSKFYVTYRIYDSTKTSDITNFRAGSVANTLIEAVSIALSNIDNNNYYLFLNNFLKYATGEALDALAYPWGITRNTATSTEGWLAITPASGTDISITQSHRFSTVGRGAVFKSKSEYVGTIASGATTTYIEIVATDVGSSFNTGPNTIIKMWKNDALLEEEENVSVSNYPTYNGSTNYFNNGTDEENDEELRARIYNAATKQGSATYTAIEAAVEDLSGVVEARVYDIENKPFLAENYFQVFVLGEDKIIADTSLLNDINTTISNKKPVGSTFTVYQPIPKYTYLSLEIVPEEGYWYNREAVASRVNSAISTYLDNLGLGEDIVYSEIVERTMDVTGVYSSKVEKFYVSTSVFSTENDAYPLEYIYNIDSSSGTAFGQEFYMGTKSWRQHETFVSGSTTYSISGSSLSTKYSNPLVYLTIEDSSGKWLRNPLYNADYYNTNTSTTISIFEAPPSGTVGKNLSAGDDLVFIYESFDYDEIIGAMVTLSGSIGDQVELSIWSGAANEPSTKLASGTATITSTTPQLCFAEFDSTLTLDDQTAKHWLVASGISTSGSCYVGTNTDGEVPDSTEKFKFFSGSSWVTASAPMKMVVMMPVTSTQNAIVDDEIWKSEVALEYETNISTARKES